MMKRAATIAIAAVLAGACGKKVEDGGEGSKAASEQQVKAGAGVDLAAKKVFIGALNDESGPAMAIGRPFANGKRLLAAVVNAGGSGLLPEGWTIELVEKDHAYNPQKSVQAYKEIKDNVLFIASSFGTPNTLPLRDMLARDGIVAFPASLSSLMAEHEFTPPLAPSYKVEAMRAVDFVADSAGEDDVLLAIVYQKDDYGKDALEGLRAGATTHKKRLAGALTVDPGQKDVTAIISALKKSGATHVYLAVLPSTTAAILGTAAQLDYKPLWLGATPSWNDAFFEVLPPEVLESFHWVMGSPYWGEDVPGMDTFTAAFNDYGKGMGKPDYYSLMSFIAGMIQLEALSRAINDGDITREGFRTALRSIKDWNAGGMLQPVDLSQFPFAISDKTRVLKADPAAKGWSTVADYASPASLRKGN